MKYDAFISYRHTPLDMEIAKKLHKGLETFPVPAAVQKSSGKKKISRVFRDEEELPIGSDLTEEITAALKESEYLIVVCSPDTPGSIWVQREIETFISLHDRSHVLAILINGEPADSFPKILTEDDEGNPVEPLAADVRGADAKERNKKFNTEIIRLAAPILGCSYDDLRQRHRERFIRRLVIEISALAGAVAAAGILFGIYNARMAANMQALANDKAALAEQMSVLADEKTKLADDIYEEYQDKLKNQSRFYASLSKSIFNDGYRRDAALVAAEGLSSNGNERPYVPEAEYALGNALRAYDNGDIVDFGEILHHEKIVTDMKISNDKSRLLTKDSGNDIHVWSAENWKEELRISRSVKDNGYMKSLAGYDGDKDHVYVATEDSVCKYDNEGKTVWEEEPDEAVKNAYFYPDIEKGFLVCNDQIVMIDLDDGHTLDTYDNGIRAVFGSKAGIAAEQGIFVCQHIINSQEQGSFSIIDFNEDKVTDVTCKGKDIFQLCTTSKGNIAVLDSENDYLSAGFETGDIYVELFDPRGERLWCSKIDVSIRNKLSFKTALQARGSEKSGGAIKDSIVFSIENHIINLDEETGEVICDTTLADDAKTVMVSESGPISYAAYETGNIEFVNIDNGTIYLDNTFRTYKSISAALICNSSILLRTMYSTDVIEIGYHRSSDTEDLKPVAKGFTARGVCNDGRYYVMGDYAGKNICFYDYNGEVLYALDDLDEYVEEVSFYVDKTVLVTKKRLFFVDPNAQTVEEVAYKDIGIDEYLNAITLTSNGVYATCTCFEKIYLVDTVNRSIVCTYEVEDKVGKAVSSEDGRMLFISPANEDLIFVDTSTMKETGHHGEHLMQLSEVFSQDYLTVSPDGRFVAMCCMDDVVRIMDVNANKVFAEVNIPSSNRVMLKFTEDSERLIMQGDDLRVKIWGLREGDFLGYFDAVFQLKYLTNAPGNGEMAVFDDYGMYLLETEGYKCKAYVPYCIAYISDNRSFIQYNSGRVTRCYYKDVDALLTELENQFPGQSLSKEERDRYNVN